jgi:mRNA interferase HigB
MRVRLRLHLISRRKLLEAARKHRELSGPLDVWYRVAKKAAWGSLADVRLTFPSADAVGRFTVFNIKGNAFRLITEINYRTGRIFLREVLTHTDYSRGGWKE